MLIEILIAAISAHLLYTLYRIVKLKQAAAAELLDDSEVKDEDDGSLG